MRGETGDRLPLWTKSGGVRAERESYMREDRRAEGPGKAMAAEKKRLAVCSPSCQDAQSAEPLASWSRLLVQT